MRWARAWAWRSTSTTCGGIRSSQSQLNRAGKRILGYHICDWLPATRDLFNDRGMMGDGVIDLPLIANGLKPPATRASRKWRSSPSSTGGSAIRTKCCEICKQRAVKLGYFTMPLHPVGRDWRQTLAEDREAMLLAEQLGFEEAFIGEHVTDLAETITSCLIFIATLARDTKRIRLGSGTVNLANRHPAVTAAEIAMVDTLLEGPLHPRRRPRRPALGRGDDGNARRRPQRDLRRGDRAHDRALDAGAAVPPAGQALAASPPSAPGRRTSAGRDAQAVPEAASADRGHRDPAELQRHRRRGRARLDADLGQLRASLGGEDALAEVRRGLRARRARGDAARTGAWRRASSSPTTTRRCAA